MFIDVTHGLFFFCVFTRKAHRFVKVIQNLFRKCDVLFWFWLFVNAKCMMKRKSMNSLNRDSILLFLFLCFHTTLLANLINVIFKWCYYQISHNTKYKQTNSNNGKWRIEMNQVNNSQVYMRRIYRRADFNTHLNTI